MPSPLLALEGTSRWLLLHPALLSRAGCRISSHGFFRGTLFFTFYAIRVVQAFSEVLNDRKDDNKQYYLSKQSPAHASSFFVG